MDKNNPFNFGLVGCGRISQSYIAAIKECPNVRLTAVMDTRAEVAQAAAEAAGCAAYTNLERFSRESAIDGAIICAPPIDHMAISCQLMQRGIHILCEKPFATRIQDAEHMIQVSRETDRVIMMASKFRHVEDVIRAKAIIASGMLGQPLFYENWFCDKVQMLGRWNSDPEVGGGGVLIDNGTHSVDIVRYLLGPIARVCANESRRVDALPVEDTASLAFTTESGVLGSIQLSWSLKVERPDYVSIRGTDGALSIGWRESKYQHNGHPEWVNFGTGYSKIEAFKNQVLNFVGTIQGVTAPIISLEDALCSVKTIDAAYRSMQYRTWINMEGASSSSHHRGDRI